MQRRRGGKRVGYIRVSSIDQNTERQLDGVELDKTFTDKVSGKDVNRPQLKAALDYLRDGDVLVVHSMDRLARNLVDLRTLVDGLTGRGVQVEFVKERLSFTGEDTLAAKLLLNVMGAVAEFERAMLKERQREGIAIAKKAGVYTGRKPSLTPSASQSFVRVSRPVRRRQRSPASSASPEKRCTNTRRSLPKNGDVRCGCAVC